MRTTDMKTPLVGCRFEPKRSTAGESIRAARQRGSTSQKPRDLRGFNGQGRGLEPRTSCMPSARNWFVSAQSGPRCFRELVFQFAFVQQCASEFISNAEVVVEKCTYS